MGEVWKARDTRLNRTVAIKVSKSPFQDRFEREALAIAALNHPNVAQTYDVGRDYIVMEYIDGQPPRPLSDVRKVLDSAIQIVDGLAAAHSSASRPRRYSDRHPDPDIARAIASRSPAFPRSPPRSSRQASIARRNSSSGCRAQRRRHVHRNPEDPPRIAEDEIARITPITR
jgi:hypothetical protein